MLGMGGISGAHRSAWKQFEDAKVIACCDIRPEKADAAAEDMNAKAYYCYEDMAANEEYDILDICLPTNLHVDYAVQALEKAMTEDAMKAKDYAKILMYQAQLMADLPIEDVAEYTELVCRLMK